MKKIITELDQEINNIIRDGVISALKKRIDSLMWDIVNVWGGLRISISTKSAWTFNDLYDAINSSEEILIKMRETYESLKQIELDNK